MGLGFSGSGSGMGFSHSRLLYSVTETDGASISLGMSGGASFSGVERIAERSVTFADGAGPPPTSGISACSISGAFPGISGGACSSVVGGCLLSSAMTQITSLTRI